MSGTDKHTGVKASYAAAEQYRQTADEHVRTLKDFWKDFLVSGLFVLAAIVIIFACLAWFAANNSVSATGSTISAKGARFTLTAAGEGEANSHTGYYERTEPSEPTQKKLSFELQDSMIVTSSSNLNNDSDDGIYPGARGVLTFTVTPLATDLNDVQIDLSRILQTADKATLQTGTGLTDEQLTLLNLFKSHLLFFEANTAEDGSGFYSEKIGSSITIKKEKFYKKDSTDKKATEPVVVHIYWVWPEYLQNFVLTGDALYYKNLFAEAGDSPQSDYRSMQSSINKNKAGFYFRTSESVDPQAAPDLGENMSADNIATCAELYNSADEYLGDRIAYVQLRISAQEITAQEAQQ